MITKITRFRTFVTLNEVGEEPENGEKRNFTFFDDNNDKKKPTLCTIAPVTKRLNC